MWILSHSLKNTCFKNISWGEFPSILEFIKQKHCECIIKTLASETVWEARETPVTQKGFKEGNP